MKLHGIPQDKICWKPQYRRDDYAGLVMYNEWKTPEERNKHCIGFLMKRESEVNHAPPGETQSGEM